MRPPPDIKPITELSIICFVHALGGNPMLPHIEIHCKTTCGSMALSWPCPGPVLALSWPCPDLVLNPKPYPFWPKNVPGKTSQRKRVWSKKRFRRPKGKPLKKSWCGNNTFLVPGPFSTPKRKTSERKPFWPKNVFSGVWENEIDQIWNALGKGSGDSNLAEHHWWGTHGLNAAICTGPCKTFRGKLSKLANRSEVKGYRHQKYSMFCKLWYQCNQHMAHYVMSI